MANKWTVAPDTVRADLKDPRDGEAFWVSIKKRLTIGESKEVQTAGLRSVTGFANQPRPGHDREMAMNVDWKRQSLARTFTYLVDWSLADDKGRKLRIEMDVIESLDPQVYEVIENAITKVVEAAEAEKKAQSGEPSQSQS